MPGVRYEKYGNSLSEYPLWLGADLERSPYNCSREHNWHENLEIQLCTAGKGAVLLDGERYDIAEGDVVVVNSNVIHRTFTDEYLRYTCLIISVDWCKCMNINYDLTEFTPFVKSDRVKKLILKLVSVYLNTDDTLHTAKLNDILLQLMIEVVEKHSETRITVPPKSKKLDVVKSTITFIQKSFNRKLTLDEISEAVHFDKYSLCKEFKRLTGQTIIEYLHKCRTIKAIDYLEKGFTVTETAYMCGFENISFFTKIFKRYAGKTPSHYKK